MAHALQKKICLLGVFAVGKTSLVARYVLGKFSDRYLATLGVKIDRKVVYANGREVSLLVWDMAGEDEFSKVNLSYLRGAAGYVLVLDGTRRITVSQTLVLQQKVLETVGPIPFVVMLNKADLESEWEITQADLKELKAQQWEILKTSAKTGDGVEAAFAALAARLVPEEDSLGQTIERFSE